MGVELFWFSIPFVELSVVLACSIRVRGFAFLSGGRPGKASAVATVST